MLNNLPNVPNSIFEETTSLSKKENLSALYKGVSEGERNNALVRLVGSWVNDGGNLKEIEQTALEWNKLNDPPEEKEIVTKTVKSIYKKHFSDKEILCPEDFDTLIENTKVDTLKDTLIEIAKLETESLKAHYVNVLSKRLDISKRSIQNDLKHLEPKTNFLFPEEYKGKLLIAHPAYELSKSVISIGFKEKIVIDNKPEDRNIYLIHYDNEFSMHSLDVVDLSDLKIVYDINHRVLINIDEKWNKEIISNIVEKNEVEMPVDTYNRIKNTLIEFIELKYEAQYGLVAAWIIATYFHRLFHAFPYLYIVGKKESGKSRLLDFLNRICFNSFKVKGASLAAIIDTLDGCRGTLLVDQAENLSDDPKLVGMMADSYTPDGGKKRIVDLSNKKRKVLEFESFAPKVFASNEDLDSDLIDRCIQISMLRSAQDYPYPDPFLPIWAEIRDELYRLLLGNWTKIKAIYPNTGQGMKNRFKELWRPLETILLMLKLRKSDMNVIKNAFLTSAKETHNDLTEWEYDLFTTILEIIGNFKTKSLSVEDIATGMEAFKDEYERKSLKRWVGKTIRKFGLYKEKAGRKGTSRAYRFERENVQNIFDRYSGSDGLTGKAKANKETDADHIIRVDGQKTIETTVMVDESDKQIMDETNQTIKTKSAGSSKKENEEENPEF